MSASFLQIVHCSVSVLLWRPGNHQGHDAMMQAATTTPAKTWIYAMRCWTSRSLKMHPSFQVHAGPRLKPMWWPGRFRVSTRNLPTLGTKVDIPGTVTTAINSKPLQHLEIFSFFPMLSRHGDKSNPLFLFVVWDLLSAQGASQIAQVTIFPCFNGLVKKNMHSFQSVLWAGVWLSAWKFLDNSEEIGEQLLKKGWSSGRVVLPISYTSTECHGQD